MWGIFVGDYVGSLYEKTELKGYSLPLTSIYNSFTDDTILNLSIADAIINKRPHAEAMKEWCLEYSDAGFSERFLQWASSDDSYDDNYDSNGSSVRACVIGLLSASEKEAMFYAERNSALSHNHKNSITCAKSVALAFFLAKEGKDSEYIKSKVSEMLRLELNYDINELNENYEFTTNSMDSVPIAIWLGLTSKDSESCLRKGIYIGGDTDTILSIACGLCDIINPNTIPQNVLKATQRKIFNNINDSKQLMSLIESKIKKS
jgi:ADP-ribosyl-[dinitrogen reductase] hydrolase